MWEIKCKGDLAENSITGSVLRLIVGSDNLVRIKRNYKTVATCKSLSEGRRVLNQLVDKWNTEKS